MAVHSAGYDSIENMYISSRWNRNLVELWVEHNDPNRPGKKPQYFKSYTSLLPVTWAVRGAAPNVDMRVICHEHSFNK